MKFIKKIPNSNVYVGEDGKLYVEHGQTSPPPKPWRPRCYIHSTRGWNGKSFGQECAVHGPFKSERQRHGEYDIPCPIAEGK